MSVEFIHVDVDAGVEIEVGSHAYQTHIDGSGDGDERFRADIAGATIVACILTAAIVIVAVGACGGDSGGAAGT